MSESDVCPLCFKSFPITELPEHAENCKGNTSQSGGTGGGNNGGGGDGGTCKGGCGFFGSSERDGYCSMCYTKKFGGGRGLGGGRGGGGGSGFASGLGDPERPYIPGPIPVTKQKIPIDNKRVIEVRQGDIVREVVDALVNAANKRLDHASGVAGAIRKFGGEEIQNVSDVYYTENGEVPEGSAIVVGDSVGKLRIKVLIHAVGPIWSDGRKNDVEILASCVVESLKIASNLALQSIAFPAISSGIFGFPKDLCAQTMFSCVLAFFRENPNSSLNLIRFTNMDDPTVQCFESGVPKSRSVDLKKFTQSPTQGSIELVNGEFALEDVDAVLDGVNAAFDLIGKLPQNVVVTAQRRVRELVGTLDSSTWMNPNSNLLFKVGTIVLQPLSAMPPRRLVLSVFPPNDFTQPRLDEFRNTIQQMFFYCDQNGLESISLSHLGVGSMGYQAPISARIIVEEARKFLLKAATRLRRVVVCEEKDVSFFRDQLERINADTGDISDLPEIALPNAELQTPPPPENETPAQRRTRERAAAEARLQMRLAAEQSALMGSGEEPKQPQEQQ